MHVVPLWCRLAVVVGVAVALVPQTLGGQAGVPAATPRSREVLALHDSSEARAGSEIAPSRTNLIHTLAEMPLNYLGLRLRYLDVHTEPLPSDDEMRRYLGVITWFGDDRLKDAEAYLRWVQRQIAAGRRMVVIGSLGANVDGVTGAEVDWDLADQTYAAMGLYYSTGLEGMHTDNPLVLAVTRKVPEMVEFERTLDGELFAYEQFRSSAPTNRVYLTIRRTDILDGDSDVVVTGPWGGFVLGGYDYYDQARTFQKRWLINPFAFFEEAFGIKGWPRPDVSTLNGSRVFYTHVDGDGFNNVSEIDYVSLSAELLLNRFIHRYALPFTISIVVNDIDPAVLGGERQMRVARQIFAEPNVEGASHTYTHPFDWSKPVDTERELKGALDFLNQRIAPPDRPVRLVLWSGATNPSGEAIARSYELGLLNINGGDGRFDAANNSYAALAPLTTQMGSQAGAQVQFYTSNANDNIYGNDWTGPYDGLRNVIQTWQRTESPRRIGALNVYYHIFTGEKHASVKALEDVYDYALTLDIAPMFTTDYVRTVQGFVSTVIATEGEQAWRIANYGALRTIRFDDERRFPDLSRSENVLGYWHYQGSLYVFLGEGPTARIELAEAAPSKPYLARASHRILEWSVSEPGISLALEGVGRKQVTLANLPADSAFDVVERGTAERRLRRQSDAQGMLRWTSDARGRVDLVITRAADSGTAGPTSAASTGGAR